MDFYLLIKILTKTYVISTVKKLLDRVKKSATDAIKTISKRAIQKTAELNGDLIGNKIADKIASTSKKIFKGITFNKVGVSISGESIYDLPQFRLTL